LYAVRPEDIGGLFVVVRKSENSLFVYAANQVDTSKANVVVHGQALKARSEEITKEKEGIKHEINTDSITDDELSRLITDLGFTPDFGGSPQTEGSASQVTPPALSRNSKGNLELKFEVRPDDATIQQLTETGYKFNQRQKVWYAADSPESHKVAKDLSGKPIPAAVKKTVDPNRIRNFLTEIKEAGGIKPQSLVDALDKNEVNSIKWIRVKNKTGFGVDQMAIRMSTAGWQVPLDIDGNPDTNAFAQMLKDAINGNPPVHTDNADRAVTVQQVAELDQVSRLTDEELELKNLLDQDEVASYIDSPVDGLLADLFDLLTEEEYSELQSMITEAISQRDQVIEEIEYGTVTGKTAASGSGNQEDVQQAGPAAPGQEEGSPAPDRGPAGKDAETSGAEATASQELTPLSEVPQNQALPQQDVDRAAADPRTALPSIL
jgi:hypothetical protein